MSAPSPEGSRPSVPLLVRSEHGRPRSHEPVTFGVPLPRSRYEEPVDLLVTVADGQRYPTQTEVLDRWPDGSVRWLLVDTRLDSIGSATLETANPEAEGRSSIHPPSENRCIVHCSTPAPNRAVIDTGAAVFELDTKRSAGLSSVQVGTQQLFDPDRSGIVFSSRDGTETPFIAQSLTVETAGPVRTTVRLDGQIQTGGQLPTSEQSQTSELPLTPQVMLRYSFFAGSATLRAELTIVNPNPARHPGGIWELGANGSLLFKALRFDIARQVDGEPSARMSLDGLQFDARPLPIKVYQESSGGPNWNSSNHRNRDRNVPMQRCGYRAEWQNGESTGKRAQPIFVSSDDSGSFGGTLPHFWQNFPKAIALDAEGLLRFELFPKEFPDLHELQGGEAKTHRMFVAFADDTVTAEPLAWVHDPLHVQVTPEWARKAAAVPWIDPVADDAASRQEGGPPAPHGYQRLVQLAIDGDDSFEAKRERIDQYGWRHFGEIYADHEAVYAPPEPPLVSHYNNQYDAVAGFATQLFRSGDLRWWRSFEELALHVLDIDLYQTDGDKSAYNRGMFWHTVHYVDAGTGTHRSYPRAEGVYGGGPSSGHLYTTGLMLYHFLTGCHRARDAVVALGQYVIDADDGSLTVFRWLDRGATGHVSESGADQFHGPGRSPGNAIGALVDVHRLTGDQRFLTKAEELIHRTIHPEDDLAARNLGDAEHRWYYTLYLQNLGKYLEHKALLDELDERYAYAHAAFLHYARWAVEHEYPYLDKPEILEYPTETWAAQDMHKSEILRFAARLTTDDRERRKFLNRARYFFDETVRHLLASPTRSLARPVVLLLSNGYGQLAFDRLQPDEYGLPVPQKPDFWPPPIRFVSQKQRVKRKLVRLGLAALCALLIVALWFASRLH